MSRKPFWLKHALPLPRLVRYEVPLLPIFAAQRFDAWIALKAAARRGVTVALEHGGRSTVRILHGSRMLGCAGERAEIIAIQLLEPWYK